MKNKWTAIIAMVILLPAIASAAFLTTKPMEQPAWRSIEYSNQDFGFTYREDLTLIEEIHDPIKYVAIANFNPQSLVDSPHVRQSKNSFKLEIVKLPSNGLSLEVWLSSFMEDSFTQPKVIGKDKTTFIGMTAFRQIELVGDFEHEVLYVLNKDSVFIINSNQKKITDVEELSEILNSIKLN